MIKIDAACTNSVVFHSKSCVWLDLYQTVLILLGETMSSALKAVNDLFFSAIQESFPAVDLQNGMVQGSSGTRFGDYKCTAPMTIAQVRLIQ